MSALRLVTPPASLPITLDDAKSHLREQSSDQDDLINALIEAATAYAEKFQGRALIQQTWNYYLDCFPADAIEIPKPPLIDVDGVFYVDGNGDEHEFTSFEVDTASEPGRIFLVSSGSWPTPDRRLNAVRIQFRAGYVSNNSPATPAVPPQTIAAIKLIVGTLYAQRETIVVGSTVFSVPFAAEHLLRQNKIDLSLA